MEENMVKWLSRLSTILSLTHIYTHLDVAFFSFFFFFFLFQASYSKRGTYFPNWCNLKTSVMALQCRSTLLFSVRRLVKLVTYANLNFAECILYLFYFLCVCRKPCKSPAVTSQQKHFKVKSTV